MSLRFFGEKKRKEPPRERPVFDGASEKTKMKDLLASVHKAEEQQRKLTEKEREKIHNLLDAFAGVLGAEDHRVRHDSHYYVLKMEDGYHLLRVGYRGIENQLSFRVLKLGDKRVDLEKAIEHMDRIADRFHGIEFDAKYMGGALAKKILEDLLETLKDAYGEERVKQIIKPAEREDARKIYDVLRKIYHESMLPQPESEEDLENLKKEILRRIREMQNE